MNKHHLELLTVKETADRLALTQKKVRGFIDEGTFLTNNLPGDKLRVRWFAFDNLYNGPDQPEKLLRAGHEHIRQHDIIAEAQQILDLGLGRGKAKVKLCKTVHQ